MRLTLDALTVLDAIDRKGSFAAAAEELHRVPSAMTYAVQKLEEDLDALLFDRRGHRAQLTEAGRIDPAAMIVRPSVSSGLRPESSVSLAARCSAAPTNAVTLSGSLART